MTFSKLLPAFCVVALSATGFIARAEDNPAQAAARIALAKQLFDMNAQAGTNAPATSSDSSTSTHAMASAPAPAPAPVAAPAPAPASPAPSAPASKRDDAEKAALSTAMTTPATSSTTNSAAAAAALNYPGKDLGLKPVSAPPLPISTAKQQRLQALLDKYKADQLTPDEYHQQRAAILAEP
jgi:hypothetical protein